MALILFPRAGDSVDPSIVQAGTDQSALEGALLAYPSLGATFGAYLMGTFFGLMYVISCAISVIQHRTDVSQVVWLQRTPDVQICAAVP